MKEMVDAVKMATDNMIESKKLTGVYQGLVVETDPLKIKIDQKLTIGGKQIILTNAVQDHDVEITLHGISDSDGDSLTGKTTITIHKALQINETVLMIRRQGGQQFMVIGRGTLA